jgi:succinoglycan biosynthesis transport protein ExoP
MKSPRSPQEGPPAESDDAGQAISLGDLIHILLERLWLITVIFTAVMLLGVGYLLTATKLYESTGTLEVQQQEQSVVNTDGKEEDLKGLDVLKTFEQNLQRPSLFLRVVKRPEIATDKRFDPGMLSGLVEITPEQMAGQLKDWTTVELRRSTRLIDVTVDHPNAQMAQILAAGIVDEFMREQMLSSSGSSKDSYQFLLEESEKIRDRLQKSEDALQVYADALLIKERIKEQIKVVDELRQRYREKHPKLIQGQTLLADLQANFEKELRNIVQTKAAEESFWKGTGKDFKSMPPDERFKEALTLVEARSNVLTREVETERLLFESMKKQMGETDVAKQAGTTKVRLVEPALVPSSPAKPRPLLVLALSVITGMFLALSTVFGLHFMDSTLRTVDEVERITGLPVLGAVPDDKRVLQAVRMKERGGSAVSHLGKVSKVLDQTRDAPLGERADKVLKHIRKTEKIVRGGEIKEIRGIILVDDPGCNAAEAFRSLRATLALLGREDERRTFLFTSAIPGEGKTFTSCNYAVSLAQQGLKTLLIDADLRRPAVHLRFGIKEKAPGVVEHVTQGRKIEDVARLGVVENLDVLLAGTQAPNPAELLAGKGFGVLIQEALLKYERIVIDSAPVNAVSDTLMVAPYAQTLCMVVGAAQTPRRAVIRALHQLKMANANPSGIILNRLPSRSGFGKDPYYYYYASAGKYGKVYGN